MNLTGQLITINVLSPEGVVTAVQVRECRSPSKPFFQFALVCYPRGDKKSFRVLELLTSKAVGRGDTVKKALDDATYNLSIRSAKHVLDQIKSVYNNDWERLVSLDIKVLDRIEQLEILYE